MSKSFNKVIFIDEAYYSGCQCKSYFFEECQIYLRGFKDCEKGCFLDFLKNLINESNYEKYLEYYNSEGFSNNLEKIDNLNDLETSIDNVDIIKHFKINNNRIYKKSRLHILHYNIKNYNSDVINFMVNEINEINEFEDISKVANYVKNIKFNFRHVDIIDIITKRFPNFFDYFGKWKIICDYEVARRLIVLNCGNRINPINIKNQEFLWNYRDFINLHDFIIEYKSREIRIIPKKFLFLAYCCLDYENNENLKNKVMKYFPELDTREKIFLKMSKIKQTPKIINRNEFINNYLGF